MYYLDRYNVGYGDRQLPRCGGKMKRFVLIYVFVFLSIAIFASPFGLKMGMTIDEIAEQCEEYPSLVKDEIYLVKPIKKHPLFSYYAVYVNEKTGLYQIRAISDSISCNKYGTEIKNAFTSIKDRIAKTYGKPKVNDRYKNTADSYYQKDEYWFYSLREGSRELSAIWGEKTTLIDDLECIALDCTADYIVEDGYVDEKAHLVLYYYFNNASGVEDEHDSVF